MNLEKRTNGEESAAPTPKEPARSKKPVVMYIMILFTAAFLLMALSFLMHQRSNTEALGKLQNSVTAMQEVQAFQEKIIDLQEQMTDLQEELDALHDEVNSQDAENEALEQSLRASQKEIDALVHFYTLQQQYLTKSYEGCQATIDTMEAAGLDDALPNVAAAEEVISPAERYYQLKDAVAARLTE